VAVREVRSATPSGWYTAGPDVLWGVSRHTTYAFVPPEGLPALSLPVLDGSFSWLPPLAPRGSPLDYEDAFGGATAGLARLDQLQAEAKLRGLVLSTPFVRFMTTQHLYSRVPSITGCYLDLSQSLLDDQSESVSPLLRFLTDSQACVSWYLQPAADGNSRVLAAWHLHYNAQDEVVPDTGRVHIVSLDFESFVYRFWLENLIWLKVTRKESLTAEESEYLHAARRAAALVQSASEMERQ
jgi:hypothetical protein